MSCYMALNQDLPTVIKLKQPRMSANKIRNKLTRVLFEALSLVEAKGYTIYCDEACPTSDRSRSICQFGFAMNLIWTCQCQREFQLNDDCICQDFHSFCVFS